jgi:hypothetical protein
MANGYILGTQIYAITTFVFLRYVITICLFGNMLQFDVYLRCDILYVFDTLIVRKLGNFRYILIPEIINKFMTNISDPVRTKYMHVFKLNLK